MRKCVNMKRCNIQNIDLTNEHIYSKEYGDPADFVEKNISLRCFKPILQSAASPPPICKVLYCIFIFVFSRTC